MSEHTIDNDLRDSGNSTTKSSYKSIFKANSLFGGVQLYQIIILVARSKIIALLLGPSGIGIQSLYTTALELIKQLTSLGLGQSAVRDISEANGSRNEQKISRTVSVLRRLVWFTGLLGCLTVVILSPWLSQSSFGNHDYIIPFLVLSLTLFLDQICVGQKVILQGLRKLKELAKASAIGATFGFVVSVPIYYLYGINGIVPTIIINSLVALGVSFYFSKRIKITPIYVSFREAIKDGRSMMRMGIALSLSSILTAAVSYMLRVYIGNQNGTEEVGLFQAGFAIMTTYVGLVFNAISTDYYPRLAAVNNDNVKCREVVSQQGEISVMILAPMLSICLVFSPFVLTILYSNRFLPITGFIVWSCLGMMFRLASWIVSYQFVAKAESRLFIICETIINLFYLAISVLGYKLFGLSGLGLAFAINYLLYFILVYSISKVKYGFHFSKSFIKEYLLFLVLVTACVLICFFLEGFVKYISGCVVILIIAVLAYSGLNKRIGLNSIIRGQLKVKNG